MYKIIANSLDTAQLWEDWDRQVRFKRENEVKSVD